MIAIYFWETNLSWKYLRVPECWGHEETNWYSSRLIASSGITGVSWLCYELWCIIINRVCESREQDTHTRRGEPGIKKIARANSPTNHKIYIFIKDLFFDLPCKRTWHGKGRMTKDAIQHLLHPNFNLTHTRTPLHVHYEFDSTSKRFNATDSHHRHPSRHDPTGRSNTRVKKKRDQKPKSRKKNKRWHEIRFTRRGSIGFMRSASDLPTKRLETVKSLENQHRCVDRRTRYHKQKQ